MMMFSFLSTKCFHRLLVGTASRLVQNLCSWFPQWEPIAVSLLSSLWIQHTVGRIGFPLLKYKFVPMKLELSGCPHTQRQVRFTFQERNIVL